jgi:hypothetical protein
VIIDFELNLYIFFYEMEGVGRLRIWSLTL